MDLLTFTTRWISCSFLVTAIGVEICAHAVAANSAAVESLGRIVYLPSVTLQSDHNSAPLIFNTYDRNRIAKRYTHSYTGRNSKWFESSDKFKQSIAAGMGVNGSAKGVSLSVKSEFNRVTGSETNVKVADVQAVRFHSKTYIPRGSVLNSLHLNHGFMHDFHKLPVFVVNSHLDISWSPFRDFMNKWGSHIVYVAYTGAVYQSWSSSRSELQYNQRQMQAKACFKAEGLYNTGALKACKGYSPRERWDSAKLKTTDTKLVKGGTKETRSKLARSPVTPKLLDQFLNEKKVDLQPVRYKYLPVWDFLRGRSDCTGEDRRRSLGLQAYYEGWKATGCPLVRTTGLRNFTAQLMVPEYTPSKHHTGHYQHTGYYLCIRRCEGCHNVGDCHYDAGSCCCRSYGPSALRRDPSTDRVSLAPYPKDGWCYGNNGCKYSAGQGCQCSNSNKEAGCNYEYPLNPKPKAENRLKYKIIWNQHRQSNEEESNEEESNEEESNEEESNEVESNEEENPAIASVVDA